MRASAWQALRATSVKRQHYPYRLRARLRPPHLQQSLHTSSTLGREDDPASEAPGHTVIDPSSTGNGALDPKDIANAPDDGPETPSRPKDPSNYGSASRRAGRNVKRTREMPPVHIPQWFSDRNVLLRESRASFPKDMIESLSSEQNDSRKSRQELSGEVDVSSARAPKNPWNHFDDAIGRPLMDALSKMTKFYPNIILETKLLIKAGLQIPDLQHADTISSTKSHIVLICPEDGGSLHLQHMVMFFAHSQGTDFLRLSAQDIAEIGGDYMEENSDFRGNSLSSLGYDTPQVTSSRSSQTSEEPAEEEDYDEPEEEYSSQSRSKPLPSRQSSSVTAFNFIPVGSFTGNLQDVLKSIKGSEGTPSDGNPQSKIFRMKSGQVKDNTPDMKMTLLVETLLNVPEMKRRASKELGNTIKVGTYESPEPTDVFQPSAEAPERGSEGLIVLIEDYPQINLTMNGGKFLDKLHEVVDARRKEGQKVLIIGTASGKDLMPSLTKSAIDEVQTEPRNGPTRTILMPISGKSPDSLLAPEHKRKIRDVNLRHIRDMLRRIAPAPAHVASIVHYWDMAIDSKIAFLSGLDESVWTIDQVSRAATLALGQSAESDAMDVKHIEGALQLIEFSDSAKAKWVKREQSRDRKRSPSVDSSPKEDQEARLRKLRTKCNAHEKKLLSGVIDASSIRTTFADVNAPPETIDTLKTLTSLSLVRPDAFTYGVLATDRIPGLLLYGPPGTGKTLLAKAVAKESGATMLEVSGSDVYDMYVGEGEKNVKAIFTLAKKLTPCIVFIDEADAILGSRSSGSSRTSHRELINQFLREWDGMTDFSAFIMVATNRPFDLDEASLRRLPRRLLIDLPVEKDREAILRIHLKDEVLDPEVSLSKLASDTPFYSGSDLKNLAVAAALACVREEFDAAAAHNKDHPDDKYQYAEKRTLHPRHFTRGMEEISASISEDMGSLSAIRKFDEKYGDRRGRRKKLGGYGFKTGSDSEKMGSDAARVRNQTR